MAVMSMPRPRVSTVVIDALKLNRRQIRDDELPPGWVEEDGIIVPFWHSKTGIIIKWSIFLGFMVLMLAWIFVGRWHARNRIKKGLVPLGYHRWLIPRGELAKVDPRYAYPDVVTYTHYNAAPVYGMQPMPPPQYYAAGPPPPPMDAYKTDATQGVTNRPADDYAPPPGPPPPAASRPGRNPFGDPRP